MSEELSRVKSRRKPNKSEDSPAVKGKRKTQAATAEAPAAASGTLSRKSRHAAAPAGTTVRRSEKAQPAEEEDGTPSRTESYPSERLRFSKMFINSLIVIFLLLLAFLLYWGLIGAPDLNELW